MDLNNNPLVWAEKRKKILLARSTRISNYHLRRLMMERDENGIVVRMRINTKINTKKAERLQQEIKSQMQGVNRILNAFR